MTREELQQYFTEVIHIGYEKYPIWQLLEKYYTIEGVSRYYLPVEHCECTWVVTVSFGDCCGRYTHDRLHDEDFHLKSNQALKGDWLLKPGAGFWKIVSDEWVQKAKEIDIFELDMHEVTREEMEKRFNSEHPYPPIDIDGRPLMHFVQHLKAMKPEGSYDYFYNLGNGIKVYSCDTPETLAERIIGHEQTLEEMLEEQYKGRELPQFWKDALERRKEQQEEKPEDEVIPAAIETEQEI